MLVAERKRSALSARTLYRLLDYNPDTGVLTWRARREQNFSSAAETKRWNTRYAGQPAGGIVTPLRSNTRRRMITMIIAGRRETYYCHHLAWLYMTGAWPEREIDHHDLDGLNDTWHNLRLATRAQNLANRPVQKNNLTGMKGVGRQKNGRYYARITVDGKTLRLGTTKTAAEAAALYADAAKKHYGTYARTI